MLSSKRMEMNPFEGWHSTPAPHQKPEALTFERVESPFLEVGFATRGKGGRLRNEDTAYYDMDRGIFCVADGVGGSVRGDLASKAVAESLQKSAILAESNDQLREVFSEKEEAPLQQEDVETAIRVLASMSIYRRVQALKGADTTLSLGKFWEDARGQEKVSIVNIGDSRIYRLRAGALEQLSKDDSIVQMFIEHEVPDADGIPIMDAEDISRSVRVSTLKQYAKKDKYFLSMVAFADKVAKEENRKVDQLTLEEVRHFVLNTVLISSHPNPQTFDVNRGDVFLAMSDGIHDNLTDEQIEAITRKYEDDPERAAQELTRAALAVSEEDDDIRSKPDDMTVLVIKTKKT